MRITIGTSLFISSTMHINPFHGLKSTNYILIHNFLLPLVYMHKTICGLNKPTTFYMMKNRQLRPTHMQLISLYVIL